MQQIEDVITHYGDTIQEWDVVNEAVHRGHLQEGVYPGEINADEPMSSQRSPWTTQLLADWYAQAESVVDENGLDVEIGTNDFNTLTWDQDPYYEQVQFLADQGVDVDFMGHQAHIGLTNVNGQQWDYGIINQLFEQFADLPATQRITEYDMAGDSWSGHQQRADVMRAFLKTAYGHPDVDEFVIWGMWDETHWKGEAPFFEEDWSEKPAFDVWRNLVLDEWWTDETATTGSDGTATVDTFLGEHEVRVDGTVVGTVSVTDPAGATVRVSGDEVTGTPGDGEEPSPADPPSVSPVQLNGTYRVESANSGLALSIEGGSTEDGANVVQRTYESAADQHWTFEHLGDGVHRIETVASSASLDVVDGEMGDGANVRQWPWNGSQAQRFLVGEADDGDLVIVARHSNRALDVSGGSTEDGANVQQYTYHGGENQEWTVTAVGEDGPPTVGENTNAPTDPDGDGLYEDLNGNGEADYADVVDYFDNMEDLSMTDHTDAYDYNGNGEIDFADLVELFEEVN
ncbi:RICIN domain-containing protein [Halomicrobium urmianum]|uniref:RICIN domain-containing protein n=1 Tax=Halomicrobium urmianum TaxID=1586233 RepID=UPI0021E6B05D|nr:RICIN domain-containing protein [Halomicrobium urmianum]